MFNLPSIQEIAILTVPILMAVTFHELAHGYVAYRLGDPTAKNAGRLTFNPIKHLDPVGTLALFLVHIGWAKPVPVNPSYFRDPRKGMLYVSIAGPATNFVLAVCFALLFYVLNFAFYNLSSPQTSEVLIRPLAMMCLYGVQINLALGVFNLLPIPPLDGSNLLAAVLPRQAAHSFLQFGQYGFIVLILLFVTGAVQKIILPIIYFLQGLILPI
ncbi:MAG: site-2 protease family protein [Desulfohalobiaceae bacterium]